jgi:DNA-binding LacI/PurR family transcriptional regulator
MVKGIRALARHLDVSIGTVSKALNNRSDINAETKKRVLEGAAELGYVANQSGRSLRQGSTRTVGFMIESNQAAGTDSDNFFMAVFDGVQSIFRRHHLDLIVLPCASDEDPVDYLDRMVARGFVDAVIISATRRDDPRVPMLSKRKIPFVALGRSDSIEHPWIELDFEGVARQSVSRLVERGHRDIAVALPVNNLNLGNLFLAGYREGLRAHGIRYRSALTIRSEASEQGGEQLATRLLSIAPRPTAVMLSYELLAGGLYRQLTDAGVMPGRDMAVIGFRESPQTRHLVPSLTSFRTSLRDLGEALGQMLLSQMPPYDKDYPNWPSSQVWPLTLIAGDSDAQIVQSKR